MAGRLTSARDDANRNTLRRRHAERDVRAFMIGVPRRNPQALVTGNPESDPHRICY
jgi:hypothetical protein